MLKTGKGGKKPSGDNPRQYEVDLVTARTLARDRVKAETKQDEIIVGTTSMLAPMHEDKGILERERECVGMQIRFIKKYGEKKLNDTRLAEKYEKKFNKLLINLVAGQGTYADARHVSFDEAAVREKTLAEIAAFQSCPLQQSTDVTALLGELEARHERLDEIASQILEEMTTLGELYNSRNDELSGALRTQIESIEKDYETVEKHLLEDACRNGDAEKFDSVFASYKNIMKTKWINSLTPRGDTLLNIASRNGHANIVRKLFSKKMKIDVRNQQGQLAIHEAAICRDEASAIEVLECLLQHGVDINATTLQEGRTGLHRAAFQGSTQVVGWLLANGAQVDALELESNAGIQTALHWATYKGHAGVVASLLDAGANYTIKSTVGESPLMTAVIEFAQAPVELREQRSAVVSAYFDRGIALSQEEWHQLNEFDKKTPNRNVLASAYTLTQKHTQATFMRQLGVDISSSVRSQASSSSSVGMGTALAGYKSFRDLMGGGASTASMAWSSTPSMVANSAVQEHEEAIEANATSGVTSSDKAATSLAGAASSVSMSMRPSNEG